MNRLLVVHSAAAVVVVDIGYDDDIAVVAAADSGSDAGCVRACAARALRLLPSSLTPPAPGGASPAPAHSVLMKPSE